MNSSVRWIFLLSIFVGLGAMGFVFFAMLSGPDAIDFGERSLPDLIESGDLVGCIVVPLSLGLMVVMFIPFFRLMFPAKIKDGLTATATVTRVWDTGTTINDNPLVGLALEYVPAGSYITEVETKTIVSRLNVANVQPGITADITYDPHNPKRVQIDSLNTAPPAPPPAPAPALAAADLTGPTRADVAATSDRIEELKDLRLKGLITETEYEAKRLEILKGL